MKHLASHSWPSLLPKLFPNTHKVVFDLQGFFFAGAATDFDEQPKPLLEDNMDGSKEIKSLNVWKISQ